MSVFEIENVCLIGQKLALAEAQTVGGAAQSEAGRVRLT